MATGSWTRSGGATANFGPDVVYSNTANSGYFSAVGGAGDFAPLSTNFDSGVLPTKFNTNANANREIYSVNCVSIGYCDLGAPGAAGWELRFYNECTPCTFQPTFENELVVAGLRAGGCWTVDLDLSGGQELCISNDVTLIASLPPNTVGFFITSPFDGFVPNPGGSSGNICLGGNVGRFQSLVKNSLAGGEISISTQAGEWDLASIPSASGSYAAMPNLSAYFQLWHRDASPAGPTSNFTDGVAVTWTP